MANAATEINSSRVDPSRYVAFLNEVFPCQWNRRSYDWYASRSFNDEPCDVLVRLCGQRILSGITLCYVQVRVGTLAPINVSVISAAGTIPTERGAGHYAALLEAAIERSRQRGCTAALAFVTQENASGRGLRRLGAHEIPSFYIVSRKPRSGSIASRRGRRMSAAPRLRLAEGGAADGAGGMGFRLERARRRADDVVGAAGLAGDCTVARFHYGRSSDWRRQFLLRPHRVRIVRPAAGHFAVIESVGHTDRLQWLSCPPMQCNETLVALASASSAAGRNFFMYTLDPQHASVAAQARLQVRPGYMMLQPTGYDAVAWRQLTHARWRVQSGDRL